LPNPVKRAAKVVKEIAMGHVSVKINLAISNNYLYMLSSTL